MTSQSPPAGDELELARHIQGNHNSAPAEDIVKCGCVRAYILSEIQKAKPEKKQYAEAQDIADHWGMTEDSIARQIDNMKGLGFNEGVADYEQALTAKFGGTKDEQI